MTRAQLTFLFFALASTMAKTNLADIDVNWGAFVENDLRLNVDRVDTPGVGRNQTTLGADLKVDLIPDKLRFVGDLQFVWTGFTRDTDFNGLTSRSTVSPYYLKSSAAYLEVTSLLPGVDLKVGRQVVSWGTADMFNPTGNLNSLDLEDPLKFGEAIANQMIDIEWMPGENYVFSAVWVPVFQPAMLPASALLGIGDPSAEFPYADPSVRLEAEKLRSIWLDNPEYWIVDQPTVNVSMPDIALKNSQLGLKVQWVTGLLDMSLSYYRGFDSMPVPQASYSSTYAAGETAADGTPVRGVSTEVELIYPRKQVIGFDLAGQFPFLDDAGFWLEGALVFPEPVKMSFDVKQVVPGSRVITGNAVLNDPYFKYTAGMDYTVNEHVFVTGQFVHGFVDEFGSHNIHNYWIGGLDVKLLRERLVLRLFCIGELPHEDEDMVLDENLDGFPDTGAKGATDDGTIASYVIFPSAIIKPLDGLELVLGGYFLLGHTESKFAQAAAGPSLAFFRARASF